MNDHQPLREAAEAATRLAELRRIAEAAPGRSGWWLFRGTNLLSICRKARGRNDGIDMVHWSGFDASSLKSQATRERLAVHITTFDPPTVISLLDEIAGLRAALEEIVTDCSMTREQFVGQGPAFACRQVERAVGIARQALESGK